MLERNAQRVTRRAVEPAPTQNETELPEALDETVQPPKAGHWEENRWSERKAKNQTGLQPAWNGDLQTRSAATK